MDKNLDDKHAATYGYRRSVREDSIMSDSFRMLPDTQFDPFCEICAETRNQIIQHDGFCNDCVQFLCEDCLQVHKRLQAARGHVILRGDDMPKSMADKPPTFDHCDVHQRSQKDLYCNTHRVLICGQCALLEHKVCPVDKVDDACKGVSSSEIGVLFEKVSEFKTNLSSAVAEIDINITELGKQKTDLLKDAQDMKNKSIAKIEKLFQKMSAETEDMYKINVSNLIQSRNKLNDVIGHLKGAQGDIDKIKGNNVDTKVFLKIYDILKEIEQCKYTTESLKLTPMNVKMSFIPDQWMNELLSTASKLGSISIDTSQPQVTISVPEISFPNSSARTLSVSKGPSGRAQSRDQNNRPQSRRSGQVEEKTMSLSQKQNESTPKLVSYNIKLYEDEHECNISGIVITNDGKCLLADWNNRKVKMFSRAMKLLYALTLSNEPWDIAVTGDREAVVSCDEPKLLILGIFDRKISIKGTVKLPFIVRGIAAHKNKLVVTSESTSPPSVKLIDNTGRVYWSTKQQRLQMFYYPEYVTCYDDGVVVSDSSNNTLTMLNVNTGDVITRHKFKGKAPTSVTTDTVGNIYVCYWQTGEVALLTKDLSHERVILSKNDGLTRCPKAIAYSAADHQLLVSYVSDSISCIELELA